MIDIAIIGAGPAGLSAAINAKARGQRAVVFGRNMESSFLYKAERVDNHLGMFGQSGKELLENFHAHTKDMEIEIKNGRVLQIMPMDSSFMINFNNDIETAKAIILAAGIVKGNKIKGEEEFLGRGVSYCATCDGMLFRGKDVVVVAESAEAVEDAEFLSSVAGKVYFINASKEALSPGEKVEIINAKPVEVTGGASVTGLKTDSGIIDCQGVFFIKNAMPMDSLIPGLLTENGMIITDRLMQTNVPGVFAAGDCTGWPYQLSKAIGEGLVAAQQADRYIRKL